MKREITDSGDCDADRIYCRVNNCLFGAWRVKISSRRRRPKAGGRALWHTHYTTAKARTPHGLGVQGTSQGATQHTLEALDRYMMTSWPARRPFRRE